MVARPAALRCRSFVSRKASCESVKRRVSVKIPVWFSILCVPNVQHDVQYFLVLRVGRIKMQKRAMILGSCRIEDRK